MGKLGFYFDNTQCIGCRTCQIACADRNNLAAGTLFRRVKSYETGSYPAPGFFHYSGACNHCTNPACVAICPTGAMYISDDGTVQHDDGKCIGCQSCVKDCPYGEPQYFRDLGIVKKCDSCKDLRERGENPVCIDSCLMRCLHFGDVDELLAKYGNNLVSEIPALPTASTTTPSLLINPKEAALENDFQEKLV